MKNISVYKFSCKQKVVTAIHVLLSIEYSKFLLRVEFVSALSELLNTYMSPALVIIYLERRFETKHPFQKWNLALTP